MGIDLYLQEIPRAPIIYADSKRVVQFMAAGGPATMVKAGGSYSVPALAICADNCSGSTARAVPRCTRC
jgi:hypothetical protein